MIVVRNKLLPLGKRYGAINLFGILFVKKDMSLTPEVLNHERIHTYQMRELLFVPFYLIYVAEWLLRMIQCDGDMFTAYMSISFEREAYANGDDLAYIKRRKCFGQWRMEQ